MKRLIFAIWFHMRTVEIYHYRRLHFVVMGMNEILFISADKILKCLFYL
jgi:hypothetical protein